MTMNVLPVPHDYERLAKYFDIIREIDSTTVMGSNQFVSVLVFIDANRAPQFWCITERLDAHPRWRTVECQRIK